MKSFFLGLVFFSLCCQTVFPQSSKTVSQLPTGEPFKIARGSSFSASSSNSKKSPAVEINIPRDFVEALDIIKKYHVAGKTVNYNELTKSSIASMLRTLDPHSNYFDENEYAELLDDQRSEYYGIGSTISNYRENSTYETFVISTFPDSPASRAGLRYGDKFITVDRVKVSGKSSTSATWCAENAEQLFA